MPIDDRDILEILKFELDFIEKGGYGRSVRTPWKPTSIFQDSLACINFGDPARSRPCSECLLMQFVPSEHKSDSVPCHRIPLSPSGETVEDLSERDDQQGMEDAVKNWLRATINRLERERAQHMAFLGKSDRKRILIVDDDEHVLVALEGLLEDEAYDTTTAWSGEEALRWLKSKPFDLVLLDDCLPDMNSSDILRYIQDLEVQPLVIVMQAKPLPGALRWFSSLGACAVIGKWTPRCQITEAVRTCLAPAPLLSMESSHEARDLG